MGACVGMSAAHGSTGGVRVGGCVCSTQQDKGKVAQELIDNVGLREFMRCGAPLLVTVVPLGALV